jgi:hypothetical protein
VAKVVDWRMSLRDHSMRLKQIWSTEGLSSSSQDSLVSGRYILRSPTANAVMMSGSLLCLHR